MSEEKELEKIKTINDGFKQLLRSQLSKSLGNICQVHFESHTILKYQDFIDSLKINSPVGVLKQRSPLSLVLMVIDEKLSLSLTMVEQFSENSEEERPMDHQILSDEKGKKKQKMAIKKLAHIVADCFSQSFSVVYREIHPSKLKCHRVELNPQWVTAAFPTELYSISTFQLEMGQSKGPIMLAYAYSSLKFINEKIKKMAG